MTEYITVCHELDLLALRTLNILSEIIDERKQLDLLLKDGFVNMAKSRYTMGSRSVSALQLNLSKMEPLQFSASEECKHDGLSYFTYYSMSEVCDQKCDDDTPVVRCRDIKSESCDENAMKDELSSNLKNLNLLEDESSVKKLDLPSGKEDEQKGPQDPLKWFGVLTPLSLRTCQKRFLESIPVITKIATLQSELHATCSRYRELLLEKKNLQPLKKENDPETNSC